MQQPTWKGEKDISQAPGHGSALPSCLVWIPCCCNFSFDLPYYSFSRLVWSIFYTADTSSAKERYTVAALCCEGPLKYDKTLPFASTYVI